MATDTELLVGDYLQRLDAAASVLPASERIELVDDIRQHIAAALDDVDAADEVTARNVLERLGPPEEIVAAVGESPAPANGRRAVDAAVRVLLLTLGAVLALILVPGILVILIGAGSGLGPMEIGVLTVLIVGVGYTAWALWRRGRRHA